MKPAAAAVLGGVIGIVIGIGLVLGVLVGFAVDHRRADKATQLQYACTDARDLCVERTEQQPFLGVGEPSRRINVYLMQPDGTPLPRYTYYYDPFHDREVNIDLSRAEEQIVLSSDSETLVLSAERYGTVG